MNKWEILKNRYIDNNIKIIPILPNRKIPAIEKWNEYCSSDFFQVLYWYNENKNFNYAIPCYENNLFVIDLDIHDSEKDGIKSFRKLFVDLGCSIDDLYGIKTMIQQTQGGGLHIIYKSDEELSQVNGVANAFKDYPGIDLRNRNYILVEPSVIDDRHYTFLNDLEPQKMPPELKQFILENANLKSDIKKQPYEKPKVVEKGDRDNQLFSYINNIYFKTRLDYDEILCLANYFNENVLEEPLPKKTVEYKTKKVFDKDRGTMIFINCGE